MDYVEELCPICENPFCENDDIVVCPVCGTPHHRKCWEEIGKCANSEAHGSFEWQPSFTDKKSESKEQSEDSKICSQCGEKNPKEAKFCEKCGFPLSIPNISFTPNPELPPILFEGKIVNYDDEIDGLKISEIARYVRINYIRYVQKFLRITKKKLSFNWAALVFSPYWYFFRKLYYAGGIFMGLELICLLVTSILLNKFGLNDFLESFSQLYADSASTEEMQAFLMTAQPYTAKLFSVSLISIFPKILSGFCADALYKKNAVKSIKILKNPISVKDRKIKIVSGGGVSILSCLLCSIVFSLLKELLNLI